MPVDDIDWHFFVVLLNYLPAGALGFISPRSGRRWTRSRASITANIHQSHAEPVSPHLSGSRVSASGSHEHR